MTTQGEALSVFEEVTDGIERTQIGPFFEPLVERDARLIVSLILSLGMRGAEWVANAGTQCTAAESASIMAQMAHLVPLDSWTIRDNRMAIARLLNVGSVSLTFSTRSKEALVSFLMNSWPHGRVMVCIGKQEVDLGEMSWMEKSVDPSPMIRSEHWLEMVSFYHGAHIVLCQRLSEAQDTVGQVVAVGREFARSIIPSKDPM